MISIVPDGTRKVFVVPSDKSLGYYRPSLRDEPRAVANVDVSSDFSIAGQPLYPHIKLTREAFPRFLATRIVEDDGDEYFGAFLNRTSVRILIDFLNRTFRLRSCTIPIDGSFSVPCTQFYSRRCVAPCVASLCDRESYLEIVHLVRLFLRNERELFLASLTRKIEAASEDLDFETAAFFRDMLHAVENYWANERWQVWLDDTVDTLELAERGHEISVIIVSQRRRRWLGEIVYRFEKPVDVDPALALHDVIEQFYVHHLPREIRVSREFPGRTNLARRLAIRFAKKISINVDSDASRRVTAERALGRAKDRLVLDAMRRRPSADEIARDLAAIFELEDPPSRIEAFDVAHISATSFAAAASVWERGSELPEEYAHWLSDESSELDTIRAFVARRAVRGNGPPDLILIDGGHPQLNAALDALTDPGERRPNVIAAVKPRGKHSSISRFLTADGKQIAFDPDREAFRLLHRLRDEAHDLANATHRLSRDMRHFYELASILPSLNERERQNILRDIGSIKKISALGLADLEVRFDKKKAASAFADLTRYREGKAVVVKPLIVPIRFVEADGAAEDLRPIETR